MAKHIDNNPKDSELVNYLIKYRKSTRDGNIDHTEMTAKQQTTTMDRDTGQDITLMDIESLQIIGDHPKHDVEVIQIKEEPIDPDCPSEIQATATTVTIDEAQEDDDDVIFVDKETTLKYITGKISFEEYSAHLEQQTEIKDESDDVAIIESYEEVITTDKQPANKPSTSAKPSKPERPKNTTRKSRLPSHLLGLMGEANMRYAQGQTDEAVQMCMEIIRNVPSAYEPFQTLGLIYEEKGDLKKGMQFSLIAAHLRSDVQEWLRVADICNEQGDLEKTINCYYKAIRCDPKNISLWKTYCELQEQVGNKRQAMHGYQVILKLLPADASEEYLELARELIKNYHASGEIDKALDTMTKAFELHASSITAEDVNLLLDLFITKQLYTRSVATLIQFCGVCLRYPNGKNLAASEDNPLTDLPTDWGEPIGCDVMEEMSVDLRSKLVVCLIQLAYYSCIDTVAESVLNTSPMEVGDLHLDIAEAYIDKGFYKKAKVILAGLVKTKDYNLAAVWLRYGECLNAVGELQAAVKAYKKVVELAPSHLSARVSLATIQQQLGKHDEALEALETGRSLQRDHSPKMDVSLLLHKCSLLFSQGKYIAFIDCAKQVLFGHLKFELTRDIASNIVTLRSVRHRISLIKTILGPSADTQIQTARDMINDNAVTLQDLWELFLRLANVLVNEKRFQEFEDVSILSLVFPPFINDPEITAELNFICLTACMMNSNAGFAYCFIRDLCLNDLDNICLWNLFCQVVTLAKDLRHNRFCLRMMIKHPDHMALGILNGNNALISGTYKHALGEYVSALKQRPQDPLLNLSVGITYFHLASQKFAARRNSLIIQGCSFLNQYFELRGDCQESNYNLGRAMHQIGLLHAAVYYYERALSLPPAIEGTEDEEIFSLSREAAFNLSLIYKASGSEDLAHYVIQKYIVI